MRETTGWEQPKKDGGGTSALGAMRTVVGKATVVVLGGSLLLGPGTGSIPFDLESLRYEVARETTCAKAGFQMEDLEALLRVEVPHHETDQAAVCELRRLSGLTWDQIASLMGVQRRSVHFWASGKELSAHHQEHLHRVLSVVRSSFKGSGDETRRALLETDLAGSNALDLLRSGDFDSARSRLGAAGGPQTPSARFMAEPRESPMGRPPSPASLVGALQDRVHREVGRSRVPSVGKAKKKSS